MATATKQAGPMEAIVREMAYIGETDGLLMAAKRQDALRAELLEALESFVNPVGHDGHCVMRHGGCVLEREQVVARARRSLDLIAKARGEA